MKNPNKIESRFCSKLFKALSLYMLVVLCTFFGYIMIFGDVKIETTLPSGETSADEQTKFDSLLGEIMSATNLDGNIDFSVKSNDINVEAIGKVKFDIQNFDFAVDLDLNVNDSTFQIEAFKNSEEDNFIYATINDKAYKIDFNEIKNIDFSSLLNGLDFDISSLIDMDALKEAITKYTGIDLVNFDVNQILSDLKVEEKETETGYNFVVYLGSLKATINCDKNFKNLSLILREINIKDFYINLSIDSLNLNEQDFSISEKPTGNEEDISSILNIVENAMLTENVYSVSGDLSVKVNDEVVSGNILAVLSKNGDKLTPYVRFNTTISGFDAYIYLLNDEIYLNIQNISVKFALNETSLNKIKEFLEEDLKLELNTETFEVLNIIYPTLEDIKLNILDNGLEAKIENIIVDDIKVENILLNIKLTKENENILPDSLNLSAVISMPESEKLNFDLKFNNIKLGKMTEHLEDIEFNDNYDEVKNIKINGGLSALNEFVNGENLIDIASNFVSVENLTFDIDSNIISNETEIDLNGKVKFDIKTMSFNAMLTASYDGAVIDLVLYGENLKENKILYVSVGGKSLKLDLDKVDIQAICEQFGISTETGNILETISKYLGVDLVNFDISMLPEILNDITLKETEFEDKIVYNLTYKNYNLEMRLNKISKEYSLSLKDLNIENLLINLDILNLCVNEKDFKFDYIPSGNEEDISSIFNIVENVKLTENVFALSADLAVRYSTTSFYGNILAMLVENGENLVPYVRVYTSSMNLNTYIYLIGDEIYLDLQGLKITLDLSENTLNEITEFLKTFGVNLDTATLNTFSVILPALKNVSLAWVEGGIQANINDKLYYSEQAYFADIVLQAFGVKVENQIVPTQVIIGANIVDPNTEIYDSYEGYLLNNEKPITAKKNFAVYLENIALGKSSNFIDNIKFNENYSAVESVYVNGGNTLLTDFTPYQEVFEMVNAVYEYINGFNYEVGLIVILGETSLSGDVNVSVTEGEGGFELFGDKMLKVQGDLSLLASGTQHDLSIFYNSNEQVVDESGLFISYSHGEYLGNSYFRGRIDNANMSDMISMILGFMNVDLGEDMMNAWQLEECTTDFSFVHSLLGITENDVSDDISQVDNLLGDISNILKMISSISIQSIDGEISQKILSIKLNIDNNICEINIILNEENGILKLRQINASNLVLNGQTVCVNIDIKDFNAENFDYFTKNPANEHHNLSSLPEFMDIAVNTLNTKGFNFKGDTTISIPVFGDIYVAFDILAEISDCGDIYLYMELNIPAKREITWTAVAGNNDYTVYALSGYDKRISTIEYKNDTLTITNNTYGYKPFWGFGKTEDKTYTYSYKTNEIMPNLMIIMAQALGLTNVGYEAIKLAINSVNPNPSLEKSILGFSISETGYNLSINAESLTGMSGVKDMDVYLGVSQNYIVETQNGDEIYRKNLRFIDSIETEMNISDIIIIPIKIQSVSGSSYVTGAGKTLYTNEYYRQQYINSIVA